MRHYEHQKHNNQGSQYGRLVVDRHNKQRDQYMDDLALQTSDAVMASDNPPTALTKFIRKY